MTLLAWASPFIFCLFNRIRGGLLGTKGASAYIAGAALAAFIFLVTWNAYAAGAFLVAYLAGESFGWGKWIGCLDDNLTQEAYNVSKWPARDDGKNNGIHWLAERVARESKDYELYAIAALAIRGVYWMLPVFLALAATGAIPLWGILAAFPLGLSFPLAYLVALHLVEDYWPVGEYIYGFAQGTVIGILLYLGA